MNLLLEMMKATLKTGFVGVALFLLLVGCSSSYLVLSYEEIENAYNDFDLEYLPGLKKIIQKENRDLKARAIYFLGLYYRDFLLAGKDLDPKVETARAEIEDFFYSYFDQTKDFNLKNLIVFSLSYTGHLKEKEKITPRLALWLKDRLKDRSNQLDQKEVKIYLLKIIREKLARDQIDQKMAIDLAWNYLPSDDPQIFQQAFDLLNTRPMNLDRGRLEKHLNQLSREEIYQKFVLKKYFQSL